MTRYARSEGRISNSIGGGEAVGIHPVNAAAERPVLTMAYRVGQRGSAPGAA